MREGYVGQQGVPRQIPLGAAGRTDRVGTENLVRDMAQLVCTRASDCRACPIFAVAFDRDARWTLSGPEAPTDVRWSKDIASSSSPRAGGSGGQPDP